MGKLRKRMSFSRIDEVLDRPNLIEVQKNSYKRFLTEDLKDVLADVSPITDYSENLVLEFVDYSLDGTPKNTVERCKERDLTYAAPLKVFVRLKNRETGEIKESEVFMGDFPLMTEHGTFIINGAERVIVSQLVRSPGAYFDVQIDKAGKHLFLGSYPMTPATDILHELASRKDQNVMAVQAEDEIAGVCTAIGAAFAGDLACTTTSGPGLSLKSEAIGLAVMAELPLVVVDVQRGGPSTGLPTKTEQTDLMQAL